MQDSLLIKFALPLAIAIIMCGIGMTLSGGDFRRIAERPKPVLVGILGHYALLPLLGFAVAWLFPMPAEFAIGLVLVAACPSGTTSNALTYLARGNVALAVTLTVISALVTFLSVPLLVNLALQLFGGETRDIRLPVGQTIVHLAALVLVPVLLGMGVRRSAPSFAQRAEPWVSRFALAFLLLLIVGIAISERANLPTWFAQIGPAAMTLCCAAIGLGFLLGRISGLAVRDAITIGMEVGVQNSTLAIVIALTLLHSSQIAVPGAMYGLLMYFPALAMAAWGRRAVVRHETSGQ
ncbi:bile acid:sodium symporter family protein [Luteimonas sp. SX5]|uniref:Bile acid:sodium symporter family protein n=1 Tax=Luteimonas galliterrae TaxID=2940486 RepID=A0ABT0MJX9_9GAMM|nr:bile acid:sodium symporter family protein [Luteimonas galliterrae]MCL1635189.1 bile acid:sodium symporter family protein [Luteimonas galliterrae]